MGGEEKRFGSVWFDYGLRNMALVMFGHTEPTLHWTLAGQEVQLHSLAY